MDGERRLVRDVRTGEGNDSSHGITSIAASIDRPDARLVCVDMRHGVSESRFVAVTFCVGIFATPVIETVSDNAASNLNPSRTHSSSDVAAVLKTIVSPAAKVATMLTF